MIQFRTHSRSLVFAIRAAVFESSQTLLAPQKRVSLQLTCPFCRNPTSIVHFYSICNQTLSFCNSFDQFRQSLCPAKWPSISCKLWKCVSTFSMWLRKIVSSGKKPCRCSCFPLTTCSVTTRYHLFFQE